LAIAQVRAQLDGVWYDLAWDAETHSYVGEITAPDTSFHQPGGHYNVTVEATNETGTARTADGSSFPGLYLTVHERTKPVISLVSPAEGHITDNTPSVCMLLTDEEDGSLIDPDTLTVTLDGAAVPASRIALEAVTGGYQATYTPDTPLADGAHTVAFNVSDNDGNTAQCSASYVIDTTPPELEILEPWFRSVFDVESIMLAGKTFDASSPPITISVVHNDAETVLESSGAAVGSAVVGTAVAGGTDTGLFKWGLTLPLEIGENYTIVTATDGVGHQTTVELYAIRLITDRTQADVAALWALYADDPKAAAQDIHKGAYNSTDMNRVVTAVEHLRDKLTARGNLVSYTPVEIVSGRQQWMEEDIPLEDEAQQYLRNVDNIRAVFPVPDNTPEVPPDMESFMYREANDIEKILVEVDTIFPPLQRSFWYCGEIGCGEF